MMNLEIQSVDGEKVYGTEDLTYDGNGNIESISRKIDGNLVMKKDFSFDAMNYLRKVTVTRFSSEPGGNITNIVTFSYNEHGLRESKTVNGRTRYYLYGNATDPLMELDESGNILNEYIYAYGEKICNISNGSIYYFYADAIGNIVQISDENGEIIHTYRYNPFGNVTFSGGIESNQYLFNSKEFDPETELYYFGFRYYDPRLGRFISPDPAGLRSTPNPYMFAANNPLLFSDPLGLFLWNTFIAGSGSFIGGNVSIAIGAKNLMTVKGRAGFAIGVDQLVYGGMTMLGAFYNMEQKDIPRMPYEDIIHYWSNLIGGEKYGPLVEILTNLAIDVTLLKSESIYKDLGNIYAIAVDLYEFGDLTKNALFPESSPMEDSSINGRIAEVQGSGIPPQAGTALGSLTTNFESQSAPKYSGDFGLGGRMGEPFLGPSLYDIIQTELALATTMEVGDITITNPYWGYGEYSGWDVREPSGGTIMY